MFNAWLQSFLLFVHELFLSDKTLIFNRLLTAFG
jgi:hypothetical protein